MLQNWCTTTFDFDSGRFLRSRSRSAGLRIRELVCVSVSDHARARSSTTARAERPRVGARFAGSLGCATIRNRMFASAETRSLATSPRANASQHTAAARRTAPDVLWLAAAQQYLRQGLARLPALGAWCACAVFGLALCTACSAVIDSDKRKLGALPVACEPGQSAPCPCRDGTMSTQVCNGYARYDRCACAATGGSVAFMATAAASGTSAGRAGGGGGGRGGVGGAGRAGAGR